ncbi:uncharacterized protein LOC124171668 [Ischnura elegans]|uniref:uncharacterized protein LOC124171668 n=1 Tax=Ischnura elegans TaxID=197161 RepID=UPI001ED878DD|nr:uncharacterized protein LOC124171668 [Ischnura elegans]
MADKEDQMAAFRQYREKKDDEVDTDDQSVHSDTDGSALGLAGMVLETPERKEVGSLSVQPGEPGSLNVSQTESREDPLNTLLSLMHSMRQEIKESKELMSQEIKGSNDTMRQEIKSSNDTMRQEIRESKESNQAMFLEIKAEMNRWNEGFSQEISQVKRKINEVETRCADGVKTIGRAVREECRGMVSAEIGDVKVRTSALEQAYDAVIATQKEVKVHCDVRINSLESEVTALKDRGTTTQSAAVSTHSLTKPTFSALSNEHPIAFLKEVNNYFSIVSVPEALQPQVFFQMLSGDAKIWSNSLWPVPSTLAEFKEKFLANFWDTDTQYNFRMQIITDRYVRGKSNTMKQFAIEKVAQARLCSPPMSEEEIIQVLIRQFSIQIQNMLKSIDHLTVERLIVLLGLYDQSYQTGTLATQNSFHPGALQGSENTRPRAADKGYRINSVTFERGRKVGKERHKEKSPSPPPPSAPRVEGQDFALNSRRLCDSPPVPSRDRWKEGWS